MALSRLLQSNFASGELSKRIIASGDLERYAAGLERAQNVIVLPLGAVERRSGSIWVEDPGDVAAKGRLLPFVRAAGDAVAVLVQDETLRFVDVATRAYLLDAGDPIEIACPWVEADYGSLFVWQSHDVLWIGDWRGDRAVQALRRVAGVWQALDDLTPRNGPWLADLEGPITLTFDAETGAGVDVAADADAFTVDHVGALIWVRENTGAPPIPRWVAGIAAGAGEYRFNSGRVYQAIGSGTTGNNSPIHDEGTVSDGAIEWTYVHDGAGVAAIIAVTDAQNAVVDIQTRLPLANSGPVETPYWSFSVFSDASGHPRAGCVHHERMVLGGAFASPDTSYLSRTGNYGPTFADFKPGLGSGLVVDSDAVARALNSGEAQPILHYVSFERLYAFTSEGVHVIGGPSVDEPITPDGASARERSAFGADGNVAPVKSGDAILFVTPGRQQVCEVVRDGLETPNVSVLVDHIVGRGVAELAFAKTPYPVCWVRLDDGGLASMTNDKAEQVRAWAQHVIGGAGSVLSAIVLPEPDGQRAVWIYVGRMVEGAMRYAIEIIPPAWNRYREALEDACCLDAAGYFDFWNTDVTNRAKLSIIDADLRAAQIDTELASFSVGDIGKRIALRLTQPKAGPDAGDDAVIARVDVTEYVDTTTVRGRIVSDGPAALIDAWSVHWAFMQSVLEIGARLEGLDVDVFADGSAFQDFIVEDGEIVLEQPVASGWAGLRCTAELIDLPLAQGSPIGTAFGGKKKIEKAWIICEDATPGLCVFNPSSGRETDLILRQVSDYVDRPPMATTGYLAAIPDDAWSETGQIGVRQAAPFPLKVLGIVKEVSVS